MPSVSVPLTDEELRQVLALAKRDKRSAGKWVAEIVRVYLEKGDDL